MKAWRRRRKTVRPCGDLDCRVRDRERNAADSEVCAWTREGNAGCKEQIAPGEKR